MAANTDKFRKVLGNFSTTLSSGITDVATTIPLSSASGLPTDTAITLILGLHDADGNVQDSSNWELVTGVISGNNLTNALRGEGSTTGIAHASAVVVEDVVDEESWNDMITGILVDHAQDGTHEMTSPQVTTGINDSNDNELIKVTATGSAINEFTVANAAAGNSPETSMTGGDTDVGWDVKMKGDGRLRKPTIIELPVFAPASDISTGNGKAFFRIPAELNGMNLTGVSACVYTAGTTGTTDIQVRNHTDTADMLSTVMTIDSTETDTSTAATPAVIDTGNDDVVTGDQIAIDIDAVSTTEPQGLVVQLRFELP